MKKWVWVVATIIVALLIGGYAYSNHHATAKEYQAAMANGRTAIQSKHYTQAESYFQNALKRRLNDAPAQRYLTQTQRFVSAENALDDLHFASAQKHYQTVKDTKNGSQVLTKRAQDRLKQVKTIRGNVKQFKKLLTKAQGQNEALNYGQSNTILDELFNNSKFRQRYYKNLYSQALALRKANNAGQTASLASSASSTAAASSSESSATSSSTATSSSSASLTSSEQAAAKNYSGSNEYTVTKKQKELNGKTITADQIASARKTINAAGVQADAMSDQDVRVALQQANKKDMSLSAYAKQYLQ
ncbi:hypothetical protein EFS21_07085 [Levilactobacillus brevis]|uniref:hypothetical protein n=1 Tax=Levilactobacillus brevis TaxID=1580 RepID=UPI0005A61D82|nr:hypothetical protein [Levilactobacillus brevis]MCB4357459.1 hypothetical protein [Levilactobacillus brevis]MCT3590363.1 hypothetical protein [Levilactobacillus brevis]RDF13182.1 hypothetical protein CNR30_12285 [Levilactobacillus brevis]